MVASYRRYVFNFKELSKRFPKWLCSCPLPAFYMFSFSHSQPSPAGVRLHDFVFNLRLFIYLFIFREGGTEGEKEGNIHVFSCVCPDWGLNSQPRHLPWSEIKPATSQFVGRNPTNWATMVRAVFVILVILISVQYYTVFFFKWNSHNRKSIILKWQFSGICIFIICNPHL